MCPNGEESVTARYVNLVSLLHLVRHVSALAMPFSCCGLLHNLSLHYELRFQQRLGETHLFSLCHLQQCCCPLNKPTPSAQSCAPSFFPPAVHALPAILQLGLLTKNCAPCPTQPLKTSACLSRLMRQINRDAYLPLLDICVPWPPLLKRDAVDCTATTAVRCNFAWSDTRCCRTLPVPLCVPFPLRCCAAVRVTAWFICNVLLLKLFFHNCSPPANAKRSIHWAEHATVVSTLSSTQGA